MGLDLTTFILTIIFAFVIGSFLSFFIVRNAIESSRLMKKVEQLEADIAELKRNETTKTD
ncbi:hypothetical protein QT711_00025 [Sporosarcina saromensis]|uniref:Uncharacterized protein n=1 Tax=Sporosarcina saromensis TaxID=359365 RepID=A0ABU4G5D1_9BACL|nr:hypothetical protein [Sporosarcina saromensis]MDW0111548.1 hypothetical protein [Sporosarcina saromensis]